MANKNSSLVETIERYIKKRIEITEKDFDKTDKRFYSKEISLEDRIHQAIDMASFGGYLTAMREIVCLIKCCKKEKNFYDDQRRIKKD